MYNAIGTELLDAVGVVPVAGRLQVNERYWSFQLDILQHCWHYLLAYSGSQWYILPDAKSNINVLEFSPRHSARIAPAEKDSPE